MKASSIIDEYRYQRFAPYVYLTDDPQENVKIILKAFGFHLYKKIYKFCKKTDPKFFYVLMSLVAKATIQPDFLQRDKNGNILMNELDKDVRQVMIELGMKKPNIDEFNRLYNNHEKDFKNFIIIPFMNFLQLQPNFNSPTILGQYKVIFKGFLENIQINEHLIKFGKIKQDIYDYQRLMDALAVQVFTVDYRVF